MNDLYRQINSLENLYVSYPRLQQTFEKVKECHEESKFTQEPSCLLLTGDTGVGKTTFIKQYLNRYPRKVKSERIPVFCSSIPAQATIKGVVTGLLAALGDPFPAKGSTVVQTLRLYRFIKACKVELIILDEFQHLIESSSSKINLQVADWLKMLINETETPLILIGMPSSEAILEESPQLRRRFLARQELTSFGWTESKNNEFRKLLASIDKRLPFEKSGLADYEIAFRFFVATGGVIGKVMSLIRRAGVGALKGRDKSLSLDHLAKAFDDKIGCDHVVLENPFRVPMSTIVRWKPAKQIVFQHGVRPPRRKRTLSGSYL